MPKFTNRENEKIILPDGRIVFLSRSDAVVGCVVCLEDNVPYVLVVERGPAVDNSGKLCLPCGYLDWDEDFTQAVKREIFEETALDVDALYASTIYIDFHQPYYVESSPKAHRQNVSNHFGLVLSGPRPELKESAGMRTGEITKVQWMKASDLLFQTDETFAFWHHEMAIRFLCDRGIPFLPSHI